MSTQTVKPVRVGAARTGVLLWALAMAAWSCAAARAGDEPAGSADYLAGLDALAAGKWADAQASLDKAVAADSENSDYRTTHGVAMVLNEKFTDAIKELSLALRMRADDWEAKLWLGAAYNMSGDPGTGARYVALSPVGQGPPRQEVLQYSTYVLTMSHSYWDAGARGRHIDHVTGKAITTKDIAAEQFPKAGALFAGLRKQASAPTQLANDLLARAKDGMAKGRFADAAKDLDSLLAKSPENTGLLLMHADCLLKLGDCTDSRREYTRVLTALPARAEAYRGRAIAAAMLADRARAESDLTIAEKLGAADVQAARQSVGQTLANFQPTDPSAALDALARAAEAGRPVAELNSLAIKVAQAVNARRLRYDEFYQDRIRALESALAADPNNPDRLADLAEFLFAESLCPREQVEPGSWPVYYRYVPQSVPRLGPHGELMPALPNGRTTREVAAAAELLDRAMAASPRHLRSLAVRGRLLNWRNDYGSARKALDLALASKPDDADLLHDRSIALDGIARGDRLAAAALQMPQITTVRNADGSTTTTTVYPSQADLARAAELEREADECHRQATQDMTAALKLSAGSARGAFYQGMLDSAARDFTQAQADLRLAVKLDPKFREAWEQLALICLALKQPADWAAACEGAYGSVQTTAGPWLVVAREAIDAGQFKPAREALAKARSADPADPRTSAYLGVIESKENRSDAAQAAFSTALALEHARNLLRGRDLTGQGGSELLPVTPADAALTVVLRNRAGGLLFAQNRVAQAQELFKVNVAWLSRQPRELLEGALPAGGLPGGGDANAYPPIPSETAGGLLIRAKAGVDYTAWARRYDNAKDTALAAATFNRLVVEFKVTDPRPEIVQAVVDLGLAELEVSKGNLARARELLRNEGATPQPLWQEMRRVDAQSRGGG
ncbi:MAG: hypothetical protein BIFFINMI_00573 [Phycisphaerae bacterium]|nr:hypothetical protein [Phycisphaerae bacterium]